MAVAGCTDLGYLYSADRGIRDITLTLARGEILGVLGPNGSGKSTLLKCLAGLLRPTAGRLSLFDHPAPPIPAHLRRRMGVLFDTPAHFEDLTGRENAAFFAHAYGLPPDEARRRLHTLFARLDLLDQADHRVGTYSYGMRRKLALAEVLLHRPDLILLDEPGIGLDYAARVSLAQMLRERASEGAAVFLATNDVTEAEQLCDRVAFLHRGRLIACETPATLLAGLAGKQEIGLQLTAPVDLAPLQSLPEVMSVAAGEDATVHVLTRNGSANIAAIVGAVTAAGGRIRSLNVQSPNLGDVFLALTGEPLQTDRSAPRPAASPARARRIPPLRRST